ncbi:TadE/TadG family type IV pilus assembly protein [Sphingoaurantiacus capsulatus]|uniref:TadE/TadG family type IV pilus assembly protein n=1 Tax=Sphingoaurantiacus capsulatus TaxID=1771310 RepID=A0ABV7XHJ2_9SPHN
MSGRIPILRRLRRDQRGAAVVEFAFMVMPMLMMLLGGIELGYLAYSKTVLEGAIRQASHMAATGQYSADDIGDEVRERLARIGAVDDDVEIVTRAYGSFEDVQKPEPLTSDVEPLGGAPGRGDCFIDLNGDGQWSEDASQAGLGASEDIVYFEVTATYPLLFKMMGKLLDADEGRMTLVANATVKNEPFGDEREPAVERCIS